MAPRPARAAEAPPESDRHPRRPASARADWRFSAMRRPSARFSTPTAPDAFRMPGSSADAQGIGKATLAWRFARFLLAHPDPDTPEVRPRTPSMSIRTRRPRAASRRWPRRLRAACAANGIRGKPPKHFTEIRVDEVRAATRPFRLSAAGGGWRIAIIDSADDLNPQAANALLKMIEEPPPRSLFLLVSHQPGRLLADDPLALPPADAGAARARTIWRRALGVDSAPRRRSPPRSNARRLGRRGAGADGRGRLALRRRGGGVCCAPARQSTGATSPRLPTASRRPAPKPNMRPSSALVFHYLDDEVRRRAPDGAARLAPLAEVWEKFGEAARETETLNLDKRPLVLSIFADLGPPRRPRDR